MLIDVNTIVSLVPEAEAPTKDIETILLTVFVALGFVAIHFWSHHLYQFIDKSEQIASSFSGGMAIAYVFIHLLPELESSEKVLGSSLHFIVLIGFLLFYSMQSLVWKSNINQKNQHFWLFYIEILFYCLYNGLLVYSLPEQFQQMFLFAVLYLISIGFHLLNNNYTLSKKYPHKFKFWGRYYLIASVVSGFLIYLLANPTKEFISDCIIAMLAGSIMFNVFYEELPSPKTSSVHWFAIGVMAYVILLTGSWVVN